jgi:DNA-binding transcriptional ArsR family regulator
MSTVNKFTSKLTETVYKVAMSIPTEGHTLPESYDNHLVHAQRMGAWEQRELLENKLHQYDKETPFHPYRFELYWYTTGRLLTQMARERLITEALKAECDFILMYDDDMTLPMDYAQAMLLDMVEHPEISVLGALAFMRNPPHYPVMYTTLEGYDSTHHTSYYRNQYVKRYPKDTLVECDAVGFGGVAINLDFVRNKMKEPYFMSTTNTGEDIWFCVKAKEAGGRVFMDTRIKLGHLKNPEIVDEDYFEDYIKRTGHDLGVEEKLKYNPLDGVLGEAK